MPERKNFGTNVVDYKAFIQSKTQLSGEYGFKPFFLPDCLFDFQRELVCWSVHKGRAALFADCGMGKTIMQLVYAQNIVEKTNGRVITFTPLAVGPQTIREAEKFGIEAHLCRDGKIPVKSGIIVTNYHQMDKFDPKDFAGTVCDESSILKNFDGKTRNDLVEFMRMHKYRLLCTATAAPNDFIELGNSSEALGEMGFMDMLGRFFKKGKTLSRKDETRAGNWHLKDHARMDFWRWVCSWSKAVRKPSDLGYSDKGYALPPLDIIQHTVEASPNPEYLFNMPAVGLAEQRKERSRTVDRRCECVADIISKEKGPVVAWCYLNRESDKLKKMMPDAVNVEGKDSDEKKEEAFTGFANGDFQVLITKPSIAGFGLNWQHCSTQTFFPSHSYEQFYQAIRRSWRFGQRNPVKIHIVTSEGEINVVDNLREKNEKTDEIFDRIAELSSEAKSIATLESKPVVVEVPPWMT